MAQKYSKRKNCARLQDTLQKPKPVFQYHILHLNGNNRTMMIYGDNLTNLHPSWKVVAEGQQREPFAGCWRLPAAAAGQTWYQAAEKLEFSELLLVAVLSLAVVIRMLMTAL